MNVTADIQRSVALPATTFTSADGSIHLHRLVKIFTNAAGEFSVLKGIDVDIPTGQFVSIVGKSGSGKSTLLNNGAQTLKLSSVVHVGPALTSHNSETAATARFRNYTESK